MTSGKSAPLALVFARDPAARRSVTAVLTPDWAVRELGPEALHEPSAFIDAAAAVVVLDAGDAPEILDGLAPLASLPARDGVMLLVRGADDALVDAALTCLRPVQVLSDPVPAPALRFALSRTLPSANPGRGAIPHQRRATALLGVSSSIRGVLEQVKQIAPSNISVLVLGETGTGKELVARAIHDQSLHAEGPFVALNCGALPDSLLESELFGHQKGAFTGAHAEKTGLFEQAHGGTLFLDEIGDTSPALQVKLLRVLETREVRRLGDTQARPVDVRLISATHRDLEAAIEENEFRQDLFYRINTVSIFVPPLRRRRVDIPFLAQHFAEEFGAAHARRITLDPGFLDALAELDFPGNVRELRNAVERAIALASPDEPVRAAALESSARRRAAPARTQGGTLKERVERVELEAIRETLEQTHGNRTRAAEILGLTRQGLRYKMRRLGMIASRREAPARSEA